MHVGIMQSALGAGDFETLLGRAAKAGAEGVELTCTTEGQVAYLDAQTGAAEVKSLCQQHGLAVPSLTLGFLCRDKSLAGPPAVAAAAKECVRKGLAAAGRIGAGIVLVPFFGKATLETEDELGRLIESLGDLAEEAETAGVTLGIESTLNVNQNLHLLAAFVGNEAVKVYYDCGNVLARKWDPATYLRDLGKGNVCQIHLKDVRLVEGGPPDWAVALGEGSVGFPTVGNAIADIGYDGWLILETPATDDPVKAAKANLKFVRQLVGK